MVKIAGEKAGSTVWDTRKKILGLPINGLLRNELGKVDSLTELSSDSLIHLFDLIIHEFTHILEKDLESNRDTNFGQIMDLLKIDDIHKLRQALYFPESMKIHVPSHISLENTPFGRIYKLLTEVMVNKVVEGSIVLH